MRIAVWHNLPSGGGKRALYDQIRGLVARGHTVEAWCPPTADRGYLPLRDLITEHVVPLRLKAHSATPPSLREKLHPLHWSARAKLRAIDLHSEECARQMEEKGFDLLFAACCVIFHTPPIARFTKMPSALYLQEPNRAFYECLPELPWVAGSWTPRDLLDGRFLREALVRRIKLPGIRVLAREERRNAMAFDRILVNSFFSREGILRAFGINSTVCYLGIDTERFIDQNKQREGFVVCLAALLPNKNIEFLIQSLSKVRSAMRPKLVLIANMVYEPYLAKLRELAAASGVNIDLKQRIDDAELIDILNRARMMLYAPRLEPFGFAPLEANACGVPVVAVAEGGVRETVQDGVNGLLVQHEPQSMAEAITRLLVDDELHRRLSRSARELVISKWSLQSSVDELERSLKTLVNKDVACDTPPSA